MNPSGSYLRLLSQSLWIRPRVARAVFSLGLQHLGSGFEESINTQGFRV